MDSLLCLLLLLLAFTTSFAAPDLEQQLLSEEKRFAPFSVAKLYKAHQAEHSTRNSEVDALRFACKTLFCHLKDDDRACNKLCFAFSELNVTKKSYDVITRVQYKTPTKSYRECVDRFDALVGKKIPWFTSRIPKKPTIVQGLCRKAYECKEHQAYEQQLINFFNYARELQVKQFVDRIDEMVANVNLKKFAPFPVDKYIQGHIAIARAIAFNDYRNGSVDEQAFNLACKAQFCHFKEDWKCNQLCMRASTKNLTAVAFETFTTADFGIAAAKEVNCVKRLLALGLRNSDVFSLCDIAYQCKEHQLYEQKYIEFVKYLHDQDTAKPVTTAAPVAKPIKRTLSPFEIEEEWAELFG